MTELPEPLTPPDCDLRGYGYMPLYGQRLFGSRFYSLALRNPRAGMAGLKLWWEAWNQCPAGSLPDDDFDLARMADFGTDIKSWRLVKEAALHGFIKCSDGRLYNAALCEHCLDAFDLRLKSVKKREADRERLRAWREKKQASETPPDDTGNASRNGHDTTLETPHETQSETLSETRFVAGRSEVKGKEDSVLRTGAGAPPDARAVLWAEGLGIVGRLTGKPPNPCRALLGRLLRPLGDDCAGLMALLREAEEARPIDPVPWLMAAVQTRSGTRTSQRKADNDAFMAQWLAGFEPNDRARLQ